MRNFIFRTIVFLLFTFFGNCIGHAQTQRLVIWQRTGEKVYYDLAENPRTTFEEGNIVITTSGLSITYPREKVLRYTYEIQSTGVESDETFAPVRVSQQGNDLIFDNLQESTLIQIFTTDGKLMVTQKVADNHSVKISLATYPVGIYLVKVNDATYKMMKR